MSNVIENLKKWQNETTSPLSGLAAEAYVGKNFWDLECKTVLAKNWVCIGFAHELGEKGSVVPVTVANKPLFMVKNMKGEIAVFHNVCMHRCVTLIDERKNVGRHIRCPYHAWAYNLDGSLHSTPYFGGGDKHVPEGFNLDEHGLRQVRSTVWHDWIFVNLDGNAPDFEEYAKPLINRLSGIDFDKVEPVAVLDFGEIAANWKLIMENFIEPYHVQFVHSTTTGQPLKQHYTVVDGVCLGSAVDLKQEKGMSGSLAVSSRYLTLFPNFILGRYFPDQIGVYLNIPISTGITTQKRAIYTTEGQQLNEEEIGNLKSLWWDVHKEDHEICERMQLGRSSPVSEGGGVLSPHWEDSVRAFQELVAKDVINLQH